MALAGGAALDAVGRLAPATQAAIVWEHSAVPYLQLSVLDRHLADGAVLALVPRAVAPFSVGRVASRTASRTAGDRRR